MPKIPRDSHLHAILSALDEFPIVSIIGARQVGKSTMARDIAARYDPLTHYFDLERPRDLQRLADPELALAALTGLVILDEAQQKPELFPLLRVLADRPESPARFLILGSVSPDLRRQAGESLAGRLAYYDLSGFRLPEVGRENMRQLWVRGGFPDAFTAPSDRSSVRWRDAFIQTYLERDLSGMGFDAPPETLRRFWTMLAHSHGQVLHVKRLAEALGESHHRTRRYLDALTSTFMVRQHQPWFANIGKRQVKTPKMYIADTGFLHALLGIASEADLLSHPIAGASWESFAMAEMMRRLDLDGRNAYFWGVYSGAELDLLVIRGHTRVGYEFKLSSAPRTTKSMHHAIEALGLDKLYVVYPGDMHWPMTEKIAALGLVGAEESA